MTAPGLLLALVWTLPAHVAPSLDENNRYAKVALDPDGVRLAYTAYLGERPGAAARRRMDADHDGRLAPDEARAFAAALLAGFAPSVAVELDGRPGAGTWTVADVGLGVPVVQAGAFSVDFELRIPLAAAGVHDLWYQDRWPLPLPGESQVTVQASPGVAILESHRGRTGRGVVTQLTAHGADVLAESGILVRFRVESRARSSRWALKVALAALAAGAMVAVGRWLRARRRGGRPKTTCRGRGS